MAETDWKNKIRDKREEKDKYFINSPDSPIPKDDREKLEGLDYFPPDKKYRFELEIHEHEEKEKITVQATGDEKREYIKWGEFRFQLEGEERNIQAYKKDEDEPGFFIPFRDGTSGEKTYGAGRYLDLSKKNHYKDGKWVVDFNEAYNPWCAYSSDYSCPLAPPENWLEVPIKAGEKKYPLKDE